MSWWIWYRFELGCSKRDRFLSERRITIGSASVSIPVVITASAASKSKEPGNTDMTASAFCSIGFRRSNEVLMAFSTEISSSWRTSKGFFSRLLINLTSLNSESNEPTIQSAKGMRPHNSTIFVVWESFCFTWSVRERRTFSASSKDKLVNLMFSILKPQLDVFTVFLEVIIKVRLCLE